MAFAGAANTVVWNSWNNYYATGATTANNSVWFQWNQACYGTATTNAITAQTVWGAWNTEYYPTQTVIAQTYQPQVESAEERQARAERLRIDAEKKQKAAQKAKALLIAALTKLQQEQLEKDNAFELQVNEKLYRIRPGDRVERINGKTKKIESYFCIHPSHEHGLPKEDVALGQKLLLESAEAEFLRIANETRAA